MAYVIKEETTLVPAEEDELVSWFTKADLRKAAEDSAGRRLTEEEFEQVAEFYNNSDFGEVDRFEQAVADIVETLVNSGEIKTGEKEGSG